MNWRKVRFALIIILIAVNAYLAVNLTVNYRGLNYFDTETIKNAAQILNSGYIKIDPDVIPAKKIDYGIYENHIYEGYYKELAESISGTDTGGVFLEPQGFALTMINGDNFRFIGEFGIVYNKNLHKKYMDCYTYQGESDYFQDEKFTDVSNDNYVRKIYISLIDDFFGRSSIETASNSRAARTKYIITGIYYDKVNSCHVIVTSQTLDGISVYRHELIFVIEEKEIVHMQGLWNFLPIGNRHFSQLIDQINILFIEKKEIEKRAVNPPEITDETKTDGGESGPDETAAGDSAQTGQTAGEISGEYSIVGLEAVYCTYYNDDKTGFYFIPAWMIKYENNTVSVYNAFNGAKY